MQNIQDKELDQLFRDKFEEGKVEPSANLWNAIEAQLETKPKRVFPVYWVAAASGLVALTVGLLFYSSDQRAGAKIVYHPQPANLRSIKAKQQPAVQVIIDSSLAANRSQVTVSTLKNERKTTVHLTPAATTDALRGMDTKKNLGAMQPLASIHHLPYTNIQLVQQKVLVPEMDVSGPEKIVLANAGATPGVKDEVINENDNQTESRGINNIGDLVNYVVDKVDKREEKFLQFKTEDDNSSLIAINIGIIKFNQKKTHK